MFQPFLQLVVATDFQPIERGKRWGGVSRKHFKGEQENWYESICPSWLDLTAVWTVSDPENGCHSLGGAKQKDRNSLGP